MTSPHSSPIPVILDTDIGTDIDDTWAIAMMLRCPELDVKMILSATGDTTYRAKIITRLLEVAGRTDIPVGIGIPQGKRAKPFYWTEPARRQQRWVENYNLTQYPGPLHTDGIDAMIRMIMDSPEIVTLICIGPLPNIAEALEREPSIAAKCRFVGMHGSIRIGYGKNSPVAEYNVFEEVLAAQKVFSAPWHEAIITPLDTCEAIVLTGENYQSIFHSSDPLLQATIENYRIWSLPRKNHGEFFSQKSSTLFDTVAVYLAFSTELLVMERMGVRISDDGFTVPDPAALPFSVAIDWKSLPAFEKFLTRRLLGE